MAKPKLAPQMREEPKAPKKLKCTCPQDFQDRTYGRGIRVMNKTGKAGEYRCTGCGSTRLV